MARVHLQEELLNSKERVIIDTRYGPVKGGRAANGSAVFLEVPYALPPVRFSNPEPLPSDHRYEDKEYILESSYCYQPNNDGQAAGSPWVDKVGLGKPTENPLFVNIACPPSFPSKSGFPVKVYIHGGFLQFGSPHGLSSQAQYVAAEREEVWVNIGYRLSAFGFLACDEPKVDGNFGFKDQWLALLWIKNNIAAFGGDANNIQLSGLSAGAHSVHQLLHHVSLLSEGEKSPFSSAVLQSNAIMLVPRTPAELRPQFQALCRAVGIDPTAPDALSKLRDPAVVPPEKINQVVETDTVGVQYGTYRGCLEESWLPGTPDLMEWQRSGGFARALRAKGVKSIVVGDLTEEWYLYSIAHSINNMDDIPLNLQRYYQDEFIEKVVKMFRTLPPGLKTEEYEKLFGEISSAGQVHLPVRLLARDLINAGYPVVRYEIAWTPEQVRPHGYVTHATDRFLWVIRTPLLDAKQADTARAWWRAIDEEVALVEKQGGPTKPLTQVLGLKTDQTIGWKEDDHWDHYMRLRFALPGEK